MSFMQASTYALVVWNAIQGNPTEVVFTKPSMALGDGTVTPETTLPAQMIRIESDNRDSAIEGIAGMAPTRKAVVYGVINHPTIADTDMAEGYTFGYQGDTYRCVDIKLVPSGAPGEIQGTFTVNG